MANRVVLDENGLRISRPGIDVLAASPATLMFRSDATLMPVFTTGSIVGSYSEVGGNGAQYLYGKTFTIAPLVTWTRVAPGSNISGFGSAADVAPLYNQFFWAIQIRNDRLFFNSPSDSTLYFKIWDYEA